jgi:hypothetical protein
VFVRVGAKHRGNRDLLQSRLSLRCFAPTHARISEAGRDPPTGAAGLPELALPLSIPTQAGLDSHVQPQGEINIECQTCQSGTAFERGWAAGVGSPAEHSPPELALPLSIPTQAELDSHVQPQGEINIECQTCQSGTAFERGWAAGVGSPAENQCYIGQPLTPSRGPTPRKSWARRKAGAWCTAG